MNNLAIALHLLVLPLALGCSTVEIINDHALPTAEQQTYRSHHLFYKEIPSQASLGSCPDSWYSIRVEKDWVSTSVTLSQLALGSWLVFGGVPNMNPREVSIGGLLIKAQYIGGLNHVTRVWDPWAITLECGELPGLVDAE